MLLDRALITELLHDLAHRLALAGQPAAIRLVGGAAIAVGYFDRRATLDIDAVYHPGDLVERVEGRGPGSWRSSRRPSRAARSSTRTSLR